MSKEGYVRVKCDCGCCTLEFRRTEWEDGDVMYDIAVLDSRYDHNVNGIMGRVRGALGVLLSRPVYFNDVTMGQERFDALLDALRELGGAE